MPEAQDNDNEAANDITKEAQALEVLITPSEGGGESPMKQAWRYLQVYADWGLRLPTEDGEFAILLNAGATDQGKKLAEFDFYPFMRDGSREVKTASKKFVIEDLPQIIAVGNKLSIFAENAAQGQGEIFQEIINLVKPPRDSGEKADFVSAKEVLDDMIADAHDALDEVGKAQTALAGFKASLTSASGKFATAKDKIDANSTVNAAALKDLTNSKSTKSIEHLEKIKKAAEEEYDKNVVIASTTVTYAWVGLPFVPIGLIAAGTVAGVYGDKAVKMLAQVEAYEEQIKTANTQLRTATGTQATYQLASASVSNLIKYTDQAIEQATIVQGGWNDILKNLTGLSEMMDQTMRESDGEKKLKSGTLIKIKLKNAGKWWTKLHPMLAELSTDPYISVKPGNVSLSEFKKDVEKELSKVA